VIPPVLPGAIFKVGSQKVTYVAYDQSGDTVKCSFVITVRDTVAPAMDCPADVTVTPAPGQCCVSNVFTFPQTFDNCADTVIVTGTHQPAESFCVGTTTVTLTAKDTSLNKTTCSFKVTVQDTISPAFDKCPVDITVSTSADSCGAFPTWQLPVASDNCTPGNVPVTFNHQPGQYFKTGTTTVTYMASDLAGNVAFCTFKVTVIDSTAPVFQNCPPNLTINLPASKCDSAVTWVAPTLTDNCSALTPVSDFPPGSIFPVGDTSVTYIGLDSSGNLAVPCKFNIKVRDQVKPVIDCPTAPIVVQSTDPCGTVPQWTFPNVTDNCLLKLVDSVYVPGDTFLVGLHTFVIKAYDASGNVDTCTITINVLGIVPGISGLPQNITIDGCPQSVDWVAPTATGFCMLDSLTSNYHPGDMFPMGTTTVVYTAHDHSGTTVSASFTVTIMETQPPVISCPNGGAISVNVGGVIVSNPDDFLLTADTVSGCSGARLTFSLPAATDNCLGVQVSQVSGPLSGMVFPVGSDTLIFRATDAAGNTAQCPVVVKVLPLTLARPIVNPNPGCPGSTVVLTVDSIQGATYTWSGPQQSYPNTHQITILSLSTGNAGLYTVVATVKGCKSGTDSVQVVMVTKPFAHDDPGFTIAPGATDTFPSILQNDSLVPPSDFYIKSITPQLTGLTVRPDGTFIYQAGDAIQSNSFIYQVCSKTCPDTCAMATVTITVNGSQDSTCHIFPNIITPNGDDKNDYFIIPCVFYTKYVETNSLIIYNQWGAKVFEAAPYSNDPAKAWRGTLNNEAGKELPDGTYFYIFKPGPNEKPHKGFVEIFR
jgi:gliding motility-associated-like protein